MKGNKYDNLFGDDRDWIEEALRDHDVPDGVISEIGAHFFVLQTKVDKLEAEKAGKRDIFAEIGREAMEDAEVKAFFGNLAGEDKPKKLPSVKREPHFQSLKTGPLFILTPQSISEMWPIGMAVEYTHRKSGTIRSFQRTTFHDLSVTDTNSERTVITRVGTRPLFPFLRELSHAKKRKLLKRILKNRQRNRDSFS